MGAAKVFERARRATALSQAALAAAAGTSRPTLSAYEHGRKSPTLETAERILAAAGFELTTTPRIEFREVAVNSGRPILVRRRCLGCRWSARLRSSSCRCT